MMIQRAFRVVFSVHLVLMLIMLTGSAIGMPLRPDTFSRPMTIRFTAATGGSYLDLSQFAIADDATLGYDGQYDARKLMGGVLDCWMTPMAGVNLTVNYVPRPSQTVSIPFNFTSQFLGQQHFFEFSGDSNLRSFNVRFELYDALTQQSYDPQMQPTIAFQTVQGNTATYQNRFFIRYGQLVGLAEQLSPVLVISPTPVHKSGLVHLSGLQDGLYDFRLIDNKGSLCFVSQANVVSASIAMQLPVLPAGQYIIELIAVETQRRIRQRIVVE